MDSKWLVLIGIFVTVAIVVYLKLLGEKREGKRKEIEEERMMRWVDEFISIGNKYSNEGIPTIQSDIKLKSTELLYACVKGVKWMENRKIHTGYTMQGFTGRVRLMKGLSYRYGSGQIIRETEDQLKQIDVGDLYVTNTGFFFRGSVGNKSIPYDKIIMINPSPIAIKIEKETGKDVSMYYNFDNPNIVSAILMAWNKNYFNELE